MKTKRIVCIALVATLLIVALTGCSTIQSTLETPENLKLDGTKLKWNSVQGASKYGVYIDGEEFIVTNNSFDLKDANLVNGTKYEITVKALGEGYFKLNSEATSPITITYIDNATTDEDNGSNSSTDEPSKIPIEQEGDYTEIENEINLGESYLGYGYDVINSSYMDADNVSILYPIIDPDKLAESNLKVVKNLNNTTIEIEEESIEDVSTEYSASLKLSTKFGKLFSGSLQASYEGSNSEKSFYHFYMNSYSVRNYNVYLTNSLTQIKEMLSEEFVDDLLNLDAELLFNRYGTHMIRSAVMGGRLDITATYSGVNTGKTNSIKGEISTDIGLLKSISVGASASYKNSITNSKVSNNIKIHQVGGDNIDIGTIEAVAQNRAKWYQSFNDINNATLCGIIDDNSLLAVWELLPSGNEVRAEELKAKFQELNANKYNELISGFKMDGIDYSWEEIDITMNRYNCNDGNNYNKAEPEHDPAWVAMHDGFEIGELTLMGCEKSGNNFKVKSIDEFSIKYFLIQNPDELPYKNDAPHKYIEKDTCNVVVNTSISETIGEGAYWVRVTYSDNTQEESKAVNIFDGKSDHSYINLIDVNDLEDGKVISKIDVVVVYEMFRGGPGFMGIWWKEHTNWRCEYTFNFQ